MAWFLCVDYSTVEYVMVDLFCLYYILVLQPIASVGWNVETPEYVEYAATVQFDGKTAKEWKEELCAL